MARLFAPSDLLPDAYRNKPANVLVAIELGHSLGLEPMAALQGINVIKGKPTASAQLIGALVRRHGHKLRVTGDATSATCEIIRVDDPEFVFRSTWNMERAKTAGLLSNPSWQKYPEAMLKARAITECARDACPEALNGVAYTEEELTSGDRKPRTVATPEADVWATPEPEVKVDTETGEILEAEVVEWIEPVEVPKPEPEFEVPATAQPADFVPMTTPQRGKIRMTIGNILGMQEINYNPTDTDVLNVIYGVIRVKFDDLADVSKKQASQVIEGLDEERVLAWWNWRREQVQA